MEVEAWITKSSVICWVSTSRARISAPVVILQRGKQLAVLVALIAPLDVELRDGARNELGQHFEARARRPVVRVVP